VSLATVSCHRQLVWLSLNVIPILSIVLNLDVTDISGEIVRDITHHVVKTRLDPSAGMPIHDGQYRTELKNELDKQVAVKGANYCGSCYGGLEPESGCCNTCDDVRLAYSNRGWAFGNPDSIDQVSYYI
jgi:hypothetical protein